MIARTRIARPTARESRSVTSSCEPGEREGTYLLQLLRGDDPVVLPERELALGKRHHAAASRDLGRLVQDLCLTPLPDLLPAVKRRFGSESISKMRRQIEPYLRAAFVSL